MQTIYINASTTADKEVLFALVDVSGSAIDTAITISAGDIWWRTPNSVLTAAEGTVSAVGLNIRQYVPTAAEISVTGVAAFKFRRTGYADFQQLIQIKVPYQPGKDLTWTGYVPAPTLADTVQSSATPFSFRIFNQYTAQPATGVSVSGANFFYSPNGAAFTSVSGVVSETGNGYYKYTPGTIETSALGYNDYRLSLVPYITGDIKLNIVGPFIVGIDGRAEVVMTSAAPGSLKTAAFDTSVMPAIADAVLARNIGGSVNGTRTVTQALQAIRNKVIRTDSALTIYDESDTSVSWTASVAVSASSLPLTTIDPA